MIKMIATGLLSASFMLVADAAIAATTGMVGAHGFLVDGGAAIGAFLDIPQLDWYNLWNNGVFTFLDPTMATDCKAAGGHLHGSFCHVPEVSAALSPTASPAPAPIHTFE